MIDELWPGGPLFKEDAGIFRLGTDSVLLAYFVKKARVKRKLRVADLGCGSGVLSILLAWDEPDLLVDGIEILSRAACLASENAQLCGLGDQINIIEGDLRNHRCLFQAGAYDLTVSNPPYFMQNSGKRSANEDIAAARGEEYCTLDDICQAAGSLTRWGGSFALVHKPERLTGIFRSLSGAGLEPKRLRFVQYKSTSPPNLVLIESRRGGNPSLSIEAPLILANDDGSDTAEVCTIYHRVTTDSDSNGTPNNK